MVVSIKNTWMRLPRSWHHNVVLPRHQKAPVVTKEIRGHIVIDAFHVDSSIRDPSARFCILDEPFHPYVHLHGWETKLQRNPSNKCDLKKKNTPKNSLLKTCCPNCTRNQNKNSLMNFVLRCLIGVNLYTRTLVGHTTKDVAWCIKTSNPCPCIFQIHMIWSRCSETALCVATLVSA